MADLSGGRVLGVGTVVTQVGHVTEVVHTSTGHYNISFDTPQSAFVVTQLSGWDGSTLDNALIIGVSGDSTVFTVKTGDGNGDASDRGFSYIGLSF